MKKPSSEAVTGSGSHSTPAASVNTFWLPKFVWVWQREWAYRFEWGKDWNSKALCRKGTREAVHRALWLDACLAVRKQMRRHLWGFKSQRCLLLWLGLLGIRSRNKKGHASSRKQKERGGGGGGREVLFLDKSKASRAALKPHQDTGFKSDVFTRKKLFVYISDRRWVLVLHSLLSLRPSAALHPKPRHDSL